MIFKKGNALPSREIRRGREVKEWQKETDSTTVG